MRIPTVLAPALYVFVFSVFMTDVSAMEQLADEELSTINGTEGVQLTLRLRNNVDSTGNPIGCSGGLNPCRMGLEFSGREGIWLMLKDYYGVLELNDIRMEGALLPSAGSGRGNPERFQDASGNCLVNEVAGICTPQDMQAVRLTYPASKGFAEYNDLNLLVNIGRTALEFDDSVTGTPGYMRDQAAGSVLGFRMADSMSLNAPSRSRFDGTAYVFGF